MKMGTLIIFSGLPGSGKSTLAALLVCADEEEHRKRVENRWLSVPGIKAPTWMF
ncbi:MAG: hypothetical protein ACXWRE_11725 [Pseudobdellovibrionaceae bacterium]